MKKSRDGRSLATLAVTLYSNDSARQISLVEKEQEAVGEAGRLIEEITEQLRRNGTATFYPSF